MNEEGFKSLAEEWWGLFVGRTRANGERFRTLRSEVPDEHPVRALLLAAHDNGDVPPHDWIYSAVEGWLECFAEDGPESAGPEPDFYTSELLRWLASSSVFLADADEALDDYSAPGDQAGGIVEAIRRGQALRLVRIGAEVRAALERAVEGK